jgi:hypothetical protein
MRFPLGGAPFAFNEGRQEGAARKQRNLCNPLSSASFCKKARQVLLENFKLEKSSASESSVVPSPGQNGKYHRPEWQVPLRSGPG